MKKVSSLFGVVGTCNRGYNFEIISEGVDKQGMVRAVCLSTHDGIAEIVEFSQLSNLRRKSGKRFGNPVESVCFAG